jgi:acyl-coenzyme A thioesterase 13
MLEFFKMFIGQSLAELPAPPFTKWLGGTMHRAEVGEMEMSFTVRPEMTNPAGMLHGGIHSAILDDLIGLTVAAAGLANLYVSVNLSVDFMAPARMGDRVTAKSKLTRTGKTIVNAIGELYAENGMLLSRATTNLANTGQPALTPQHF